MSWLQYPSFHTIKPLSITHSTDSNGATDGAKHCSASWGYLLTAGLHFTQWVSQENISTLQRQTQQSLVVRRWVKGYLTVQYTLPLSAPERRGVKVSQKIALELQLLFYHEMSGLPFICFKDKAKAKLVPVTHSLKASRPGWYCSVTAWPVVRSWAWHLPWPFERFMAEPYKSFKAWAKG